MKFEEITPGNFQPAVIDGGLNKLIRIWEYMRDLNTGGYGSGVLTAIKNVGKKTTVTSCSPFTASVMLMATDARPVDTGAPYALPEPFVPGCDANAQVFYALHNGYSLNNFCTLKPAGDGTPIWNSTFAATAAKLPQLPTHIRPPVHKKGPPEEYIKGDQGWYDWLALSDSAGAAVALNFGVQVPATQMRRGDLVAIDWNDDGGHAVFCWNVHLNAAGDVDCFQFVSSNGIIKKGGAGVGLFSATLDDHFLSKSGSTYTKKNEMFSPVIADPQALPEYLSYPYAWWGMPGVAEKDVDVKSFGLPKGKKLWFVTSTKKNPYSVAGVRVVRLHGVTPPDAYLRADGKAPAASAPAPIAVVSSKPVTPPAPEASPAHGDPLPPPAKAPEKAPPGDPHPVQVDVEANLQILWTAKWIEKDPGQSDDVNDAASQAAIEDFQTKYLAGKVPVKGHADPATRAAMMRYGSWAVMMPAIYSFLSTLNIAGKLTKKPGDNAAVLDDATRDAIKEFQTGNGLTVDGIPGPQTQKALQAAVTAALAEMAKKADPDAPAPAPTASTAPADPPREGIGLFYFKRNNGPAGKPVTLLLAGAPDGKAYPVSLAQKDDDKTLVENAGTLTLAKGKASLDVTIPDGIADGTLIVAKIDGATTKSPYTVKPLAKGKIRSGGVTVNGKPFADWFNGEFVKAHPEKAPMLVKGNYLVGFPDKINGANFKSFFDACKEATGRDELSLKQFCACFMIPYNETGGTFRSFAEKGGHALLPHKAPMWPDKGNLLDFGEIGYFFWGIVGIKKSYNLRDGNWTWPAGDELKKRGLLTDQKDIDLWNGQPFWSQIPEKGKDKPEPLKDPKGYPNPQEEPLKSAQKECHFYKFRGRGLSQTTGREGYTRYVNPALKEAGYKDIDQLTNDELDKAMTDPKVYVGVYRREVVEKNAGSKDFDAMDTDPGMIKKIGTRIGGAESYGEFYEWRCNTLAQAMADAGFEGG